MKGTIIKSLKVKEKDRICVCGEGREQDKSDSSHTGEPPLGYWYISHLAILVKSTRIHSKCQRKIKLQTGNIIADKAVL